MANVAINNITDTWNSSGVTFTGIKFNVTSDVSAAGSLLMDLQIGGVSKFSVAKDGRAVTGLTVPSSATPTMWFSGNSANTGIGATYGPGFVVNGTMILYVSANGIYSNNKPFDVGNSYFTFLGNTNLYADLANTLAQRNGTNGQTSRLYGYYVDSSNYRRLSLSMDSTGAADIKIEGGGTYSSGNLLRIEAAAYRLASDSILTDSSTARTLTASDKGRVIYFTSASTVTVTTASGLGAGFTCTLIQGGLGQIQITAGASTSVVSDGSFSKTAGQYAAISAMCPVADTFYLSGDLA